MEIANKEKQLLSVFGTLKTKTLKFRGQIHETYHAVMENGMNINCRILLKNGNISEATIENSGYSNDDDILSVIRISRKKGINSTWYKDGGLTAEGKSAVISAGACVITDEKVITGKQQIYKTFFKTTFIGGNEIEFVKSEINMKPFEHILRQGRLVSSRFDDDGGFAPPSPDETKDINSPSKYENIGREKSNDKTVNFETAETENEAEAEEAAEAENDIYVVGYCRGNGFMMYNRTGENKFEKIFLSEKEADDFFIEVSKCYCNYREILENYDQISYEEAWNEAFSELEINYDQI